MTDRDRETELEALRAERDRLRAANERLRQALALQEHPAHSALRHDAEVQTQPKTQTSPGSMHSPVGAKIALFRSLFRGREDVYAVRWTNRWNKSGYAPKARHDWQALASTEPDQRKEVDRRTRDLVPLTDEAVDGHLRGRETIGVFPLLQDETCWFLAIDFDGANWADDAAAFTAVCAERGVPAATERSRSGDGAHVWIFFQQPISASTARKLGSALLTEAAAQRHQIGLKSYDRLFPNQDTLPRGGFGNLIALPLQKTPRQSGNAMFVDANFAPYPDQWRFLYSVERMATQDVESLVEKALRNGSVLGIRVSRSDDESDPWMLPPSGGRKQIAIEGPLPSAARVVRANRVFVEKAGMPSALVNRILRLAAFQNPEFYRAQAMRLSTHDKPRIIQCAEELLRHVALPRGSLGELSSLLQSLGVEADLNDERFAGKPIDVSFAGTLRPRQQEAFRAMLRHDDGILSAPTAFGKTAVAAYVISARRVNTLVLVHRQKLLEQWRDQLAMFLNVPRASIGQVGAGRTCRTNCVDVAGIQSLHSKGQVADLVTDYGQIIVDECHHVAAVTFERVMREAKARNVMGMTATVTRKDGLHPIIAMQCGPVRFRLSPRTMTEAAPFKHTVLPRPTGFKQPLEEAEPKIHELYAAMVEDEDRNGLIVGDLLAAVNAGRSPLLLSKRTKHLEVIAGMLEGQVPNVFVLRGGMGRKQRRALDEALAAVPAQAPRVLLATGSYIGEGYDDPRLDTLFLAMPVSWRGTLQQYVGRLHRLREGKQVVQVYDYVDSAVPMLERMFGRRIRGYRTLGYSLAEPDL